MHLCWLFLTQYHSDLLYFLILKIQSPSILGSLSFGFDHLAEVVLDDLPRILVPFAENGVQIQVIPTLWAVYCHYFS